MSLTKGNIKRNRPQKHQNRTTFRNDLHDTSKKTKALNSLQVLGVCPRCREIIEWKIKYKKYKPLAAPRKCVGCDQKTVKQAYHIYCNQCSTEKRICAKCCKPSDNTTTDIKQQESNETEIQGLLKNLSERKRRTLLRHIKKQDSEPTPSQIEQLMSEMLTIDDNEAFDGLSDEDESFNDEDDKASEIDF